MAILCWQCQLATSSLWRLSHSHAPLISPFFPFCHQNHLQNGRKQATQTTDKSKLIATVSSVLERHSWIWNLHEMKCVSDQGSWTLKPKLNICINSTFSQKFAVVVSFCVSSFLQMLLKLSFIFLCLKFLCLFFCVSSFLSIFI